MTSDVPTISMITGYKAAIALNSLFNKPIAPIKRSNPSPILERAMNTPMGFLNMNIKIRVTNIPDIMVDNTISCFCIRTSSSVKKALPKK